MAEIPKYNTRDIIDHLDYLKEPEYNVFVNGEIVGHSGSLEEAQKIAAAKNGVIVGKGIIYFFSIIKPD